MSFVLLLFNSVDHLVSCHVYLLSIYVKLATIFQLYRGSQFYRLRKPGYRRKPPTCRKSLTFFIT